MTGYRWNFGDGITEAGPPTNSHIYTESGVYDVQLVITDVSGCTNTLKKPSYISIDGPVAGFTASTATVCANTAIIFTDTSSAKMQRPIVSWIWDYGDGANSAIENPGHFYTSPGSFLSKLIITSPGGCMDGANQVICRGQITDLSASGADSYQWRSLAGHSCSDCSSPKANPLENAVYFVTGKNQFGCSSTDSMAIAVKQPIFLHISQGDTLCEGESMKFHATGAELYQWSPSAGLDNTSGPDPVATPAVSTLYQVIGYDDANCFSDTAFVKTIVFLYPQVNAGEDKTIAVGTSSPLKAIISDDVTSINWKPPTGLSCSSCVDPVASPRRTTAYSAEVINKGGCLTRDELTIFVFCDNGNFFLPNTFSPNGDGINDVFFPRGNGVFTVKTLRIFNRWGEVVFEKMDFNPNDIGKGWDGSSNKRPAPQDVYVYSIDLICENQAVINYKGNVALIR